MRRLPRKTLLIAAATVLIGVSAFTAGDKYFEMAKSLDIMAAVYRDLNVYYVDSVDPAKLMQNGIEAMTQSLDPYTYYYSESDLADLNFQTTGKYGGVGTAIRKEGDSVVITEIYDHTPFQQAGIRPGDLIVSLEGKPVSGMSLDEISEYLKGDPGTTLALVVRHAYGGTASYRIIRREVDIPSVAYTGMAPDSIGYIKMIQFTEGVSGELRKAVENLKKGHPGMKGLILDLRNNPGGLLNEAVKTANLFLPKGDTILSTRGRVKGWNRVYVAEEAPLDSHIPLAILTNRRSASASEIVAGAVQDLDRGIIVGQRSFGKGLVQTTRNLPYHTRVKITTARYYTPSGRCIQAIDYARHSADGSLVMMPDSLKKDFYTRDGRIVMDGGGIQPDKSVHRQYLSNVASALLSQHLIFDYATRYYHQHPSPPEKTGFRLTEEDYRDFGSYLKARKFSYQSETELALKQLQEAATEEGYAEKIAPEYEALSKELQRNKNQDLLAHQKEVIRLLEMEIMSRYHYEGGRIAQELPTDKVVLTAVHLLLNGGQYARLLTAPAAQH